MKSREVVENCSEVQTPERCRKEQGRAERCREMQGGAGRSKMCNGAWRCREVQ